MRLADDYAPLPGVADELKDASGGVRPHWRALVEHLESLGVPELDRRWERAQRLIHENGVSYNVYGDAEGLERPWNLSLVPVVVDQDDWARLTPALAQRRRLLAALLADLYGPQRSLMEGLLPPELVFSHPSFLRAVHRTSVPQSSWLPLYAADLVRDADGAFRVLEDLTQVPTGAGYALENRFVVSQALQEIFRASDVERTAPFFRVLRESLQRLAPHDRNDPRVVLLTSGPYNATYFEQAYLAQYLGYTLVTGSDLTVRGDRVYLKTLGGLQPVDVILRRVNDDYCDPLELRPESLLGVPGLVHAARTGNVAIANPLGSGLAQAPAFVAYLPGICRKLLGEELLLPSVRSWWCGEPKALEEALSIADRLLVRPTFPGDGSAATIATSSLSARERDELVARMRASPAAFVAQEHVRPSTTPVMVEGALVPRALVIRCYAVETRGGDCAVMPGGLARVAATPAATELSMQGGARSKDVWVVSREARSDAAVPPPARAVVELSRGGGDLPSRVADDLYWLGRYAERAEAVVRCARVVGSRLADVGDAAELARATEFSPLLSALNAQVGLLCTADIPVEPVTNLGECEMRIAASIGDAGAAGSVVSVVRQVLRVARVVRDRISLDTWRILAALGEDVEPLVTTFRTAGLGAIVSLLNRAVVTLAAFSGLAMESMTRGQAWIFLDAGRRIERAMALVTLLRATTPRTFEGEPTLLEAVLDIADSGMTYRRRYRANLQVAPVVDLLLTDESNPRSAIFQVRALAEHVRALPALRGPGLRSPELRRVLTLQNELELADIGQLAARNDEGERPELDAMLRRVGGSLLALGALLSDSYLKHATVSRHLRQRDGGDQS